MPGSPDNNSAHLPAGLHALLVDSLEEQIAVIDRKGTIIYVNLAWNAFGAENGLAPGTFGAGSNYLEVCNSSGSRGDNLAGEAAQGLRDVLDGERASFSFEYPCHSPALKRWFMMRVNPLQNPLQHYFVVSHHIITQRKLAEETAKYLSLHDPLTELANRRYFEQMLSIEWRRSYRNHTPISFVMLDIDYFKDYNDELGHPAGDQCLIRVAEVLRSFPGRSGDLAVRYGGEEFGLLLGNTGLESAATLAEAARRKIRGLDIVYKGTRRITISAGVASLIPKKEHAEESLIQEADKALYRAKRGGRDRIVCA